MAELIIGGLTGTVSYVPNRMNRNYSFTQQLYYQTDINVGTITISKLSFYWNASGAYTRAITLYLNHTSKTAFSGSTDWDQIGSLNQVYAGNYITTSSTQWIDITLDTPFEYNNTSNLLVTFWDNTGAAVNGFHYGTSTAPTVMCIYKNSDTAINPSSPGSANSTNTYRNDIKLTYTPTVTGFPIWVDVQGVWKQVTNVSVNNSGTWKAVSTVNVDAAGSWKGVV